MSNLYLRRYTDIPALIYLLNERKITLLDPQSWDDGNNSYYLSLYRAKKGLKTVLALCFSQSTETYHHWKVFAHGSSGVCIRFDRKKFLEAVADKPGIRVGNVRYLTLQEVRDKKLRIRDLPFRKRWAFEHESEVPNSLRVRYDGKEEPRYQSAAICHRPNYP